MPAKITGMNSASPPAPTQKQVGSFSYALPQ